MSNYHTNDPLTSAEFGGVPDLVRSNGEDPETAGETETRPPPVQKR